MKKGKFSLQEEQFIRENYATMSAIDIAKAIQRNLNSVKCKVRQLGIRKTENPVDGFETPERRKFLSSLGEEELIAQYKLEIRSQPFYKALKNGIFTNEELAIMEDKWIEFRMDPNIETISSSERDTWQRYIIAQIRMLRFLREEKEAQGKLRYDIQNKISECQSTIAQCEKSLNVERSQRLKNTNEQGMSLVTVIKALKDPNLRRKLGYEAALMKYMAEKHYNDSLDKRIHSGSDFQYDIDSMFKSNKAPDLSSDFEGVEEFNK